MRVAVVGAGIAGMGCAWALARAGHEPSGFERRTEIGGNAKTHRWATPSGEVVTGLSVLAWPDCYFHNYNALLEELGVATELTPPLRYFVRDGDAVVRHGPDGIAGLSPLDLARWTGLVALIRKTNAFLARRPAAEPASLYEFAPHNPFHFLPLKLLCRAAGISRAFWERAFVPIHSSSFLTVDLDGLPASIAPALEDIVSIGAGGTLRTWSVSSREVFRAMSASFPDRVHAEAAVTRVERGGAGVLVTAEGRDKEQFDAVVFACSAHKALASFPEPTRLERMILGGVRYSDERDPTFARGRIHSDDRVIPSEHRAAVLDGFANYVERFIEAGPDGREKSRYENTFVLSSWISSARGKGTPMFVSYNRKGPIEASPTNEERWVDNEGAHPHFSRGNLTRALALRALQGKRRTYYCGSFTTPGNGHDLSLLSGFVVADAMGAPHAFANNERARRDFSHLARFMLGQRRAAKPQELARHSKQ